MGLVTPAKDLSEFDIVEAIKTSTSHYQQNMTPELWFFGQRRTHKSNPPDNSH
jgi:hypothetical protein